MKFILNLCILFTSFFTILSYPINNILSNEVSFSIALKQYNTDILEQKLLDISNPDSVNYGQYMSQNEIMNIIRPNNDSSNKVLEWLYRSDIPNSHIIDYGDSIYCSTSISNTEKIFQVKMIPYSFMNRTSYKAINDYTIPSDLENIIEFVEGISEKRFIHSIKKSVNIKSEVDVGYVGREVVHRLYNISEDIINLVNISAGAIEYQGDYGFNQDDLLFSQQENGEKQVKVKSEHIIGTNSFPDTESQLDMQMISQTAENVDLWFWGEPQWLYSFAVKFFNSKDIPDVISMSWGWAEDGQCTINNCTNTNASQYINRVNVEYNKIGLRGTTITVSSGDAGAPGRTSEGCDPDRPVNPVFPGSSKFVTSVGATFIEANPKLKFNYTSKLCKNYTCAMGNKEQTTSVNYTGWTAGGGFAIYASGDRPDWQKDAVNKYLTSGVKLPSKFNKNGRSYPDISAVGHNCPVFSTGYLDPVDGTSCSSPIIAGIISILNQHQVSKGKPKLGFFNPLLYKMVTDDNSTVNDLTEGSNWSTEQSSCPNSDGGSDYGFAATSGYDPVTGWGTMNVGRIINWLDKNTK